MTELPVKRFASPAAWETWLEKQHEKSSGVWLEFAKKGSGVRSVTYAEALEVALCYGWIDGVRKSLDETRYTIRFTPRKPKSIWSNVNVRHVERLQKEGRMAEPGLRAYARRDPKRTGIYAFENEAREFSPEFEKRFRANKAAWQFFQTEPPSIRRTCIFWVMSAKKEETRVRRLDQLITRAAQGIRSGVMETKSRTDQKK